MNSTGELFTQLIEKMRLLRSPDGCAWDREQTHTTLAPHAIEEVYELIDAITENKPDKIVEELGDLLLQVIFHAQIAADEEVFTINDIITVLSDKLTRRHPHVFADAHAQKPAEIVRQWHTIKDEEKAREQQPSPLFHDIPQQLSHLSKLYKVITRSLRSSSLSIDRTAIIDSLITELSTLRDQADKEVSPRIFLGLIILAAQEHHDPEHTLHHFFTKLHTDHADKKTLPLENLMGCNVS